jgi:phosphatidylinositol dimannoside acyltransferase
MVHVPPHVALEQRITPLEVRRRAQPCQRIAAELRLTDLPRKAAKETQIHSRFSAAFLGIRLLVALLRLASAAAGVLPRSRFAEPVCRVVGAGWYLTKAEARAAVRDNLRHVLGREPSRREVVRVFHHGALNYWDTFALPHFTHKQMLDLVDMHGFEHIDTALAQGCGVICAGPHLGSVAFVAQVLPALGYSVVGLVEPFKPREVFAFFAKQRQALGTRLLPSGTSGARELLLALRRNEVVGLVTDRDVTGSGPTIRFFNRWTKFPDGAAALSVRTGAPILIGVTIRKPDGRFEAWIEPLAPVERTGDTRKDVLRLTQAVAERLEYYVANHPEQWTIFQRRWPPA